MNTHGFSDGGFGIPTSRSQKDLSKEPYAIHSNLKNFANLEGRETTSESQIIQRGLIAKRKQVALTFSPGAGLPRALWRRAGREIESCLRKRRGDPL